MSWQTFKQNMKVIMDNPNSIGSIEDFAKKFADEYDIAVKKGGDLIHRVPLQKGNKDLLELYIQFALFKGLTSPTDDFNLINEIGKGVEIYWTGAQLRNIPIPLLPAPGSIRNVSVTSNLVTNSGTWPTVPFVIPTTETEKFLEIFVLAATIHLLTVGGLIQTISLYPPNSNPANGFINWIVYTVKDKSFFISQGSPLEACEGENRVKANPYPLGASIGSMVIVVITSNVGDVTEENFWLSDGEGYREFQWITYPRIAVPITNVVQSCPTS